jgi:Na+-transporting NADH:ubiquinone oxidoreductase subunit A
VKLPHGGFIPRVAGKPRSAIEEIALPERLTISLNRRGREYRPSVSDGQEVDFGQSLAEWESEGGTLYLPSPATGVVSIDAESEPSRLLLDTMDTPPASELFPPIEPQRIGRGRLIDVLARGGVWPFFWSSRTRDMPGLMDASAPKAIVVNGVIAEPYRARGKVILIHFWDQIIQGFRFLQTLLADYGKIEIILTAATDPVARKMYSELAGFAWVRFHPVPVIYPVENPRVLDAMVRKRLADYKTEDDIWVIDFQGVASIGACMAGGQPLHKRLVSVGGPGEPDPRHLLVPVGAALTTFGGSGASEASGPEPDGTRVLRGGLLLGEPVRDGNEAVGYDDDAFFYLPEVSRREFLHFIRPGFDRTSFFPAFASRLSGAVDRRVSTSLRGERRPCIACGACERICPAAILPHVLHRYLYQEMIDEAEKAGVELCVDCNLCTYVCPSKIELREEFAETRETLRQERAEALAASVEGDDGSQGGGKR